MKKFITKLGMVPNIIAQIAIYYDNNEAIVQVKKPRSYQQSKHILK